MTLRRSILAMLVAALALASVTWLRAQQPGTPAGDSPANSPSTADLTWEYRTVNEPDVQRLDPKGGFDLFPA